MCFIVLCCTVTGNHDTTLDTAYYIDRGHARFHSFGKKSSKSLTPAAICAHCIDLVRNSTSTYLEDEAVVVNVNVRTTSTQEEASAKELPSTVYPLRIYGSPWTPEFCDWVCDITISINIIVFMYAMVCKLYSYIAFRLLSRIVYCIYFHDYRHLTLSAVNLVKKSGSKSGRIQMFSLLMVHLLAMAIGLHQGSDVAVKI